MVVDIKETSASTLIDSLGGGIKSKAITYRYPIVKIRENGEVYCNQTEWFTHKIGLMLKTGKGVKDGRCRKFIV